VAVVDAVVVAEVVSDLFLETLVHATTAERRGISSSIAATVSAMKAWGTDASRGPTTSGKEGINLRMFRGAVNRKVNMEAASDLTKEVTSQGSTAKVMDLLPTT